MQYGYSAYYINLFVTPGHIEYYIILLISDHITKRKEKKIADGRLPSDCIARAMAMHRHIEPIASNISSNNSAQEVEKVAHTISAGYNAAAADTNATTIELSLSLSISPSSSFTFAIHRLISLALTGIRLFAHHFSATSQIDYCTPILEYIFQRRVQLDCTKVVFIKKIMGSQRI